MAEKVLLNDIIEGCRKNNRKAQRNLYEKYAGKLLSICYRYSKSEAEDILQLSFVKIFTHINKYEGIGSFEGWMKRITVNTAITEWNKKNILQRAEDIEDYQESNVDEGNVDALSKMRSDELLQLIAELPELYRITFNLYAIEGYKHSEIAELLDISEGTSKSQISRARKMLQEQLEKILEQEKHTRNV